MLQLLHIENIAIIERADISFGRGFNALTGETGAGKSIVIDALGAVLGQRKSRDIIRTGAKAAFVSAAFDGMEIPGKVGTLAGDDTVMIVMHSNDAAKELCDEIGEMRK